MNLSQATTEAQRLAIDKIALRCKTDLYYLAKYVLDYNMMTQHTHAELCEMTQHLLKNISSQPVPTATTNDTYTTSLHTIYDDTYLIGPTPDPPKNSNNSDVHIAKTRFNEQNNFLLLLMPRGTFKSSVVTIGFSLQVILNDPDVRILIDSETFAKSKAFLSEIKGHLTNNDAYRQVFHSIHGTYPDANAKKDLWTDSQINIAGRRRQRKEPTFSCAGIDVTKTGMHYDLIIADDLMSEKNITTPEQIEQVTDHYKFALSLLDPGCPFIVIGTRWDYNDIYQHILDKEGERFNVLIKRAYNEDGSLFFPERLTEKFLEDTKRSQGSYIFSCQYLNEPVDNETAMFKRSQLLHKSWELVKDRPINWLVTIDPSFEGPYSDYCAFVLAGMDHQRDIFVREIIRRKMTYQDIINTMFEWNKIYAPRSFILETIAQQKSLQYMLNDEQKRRGTWLPVTEIRTRIKSKEERIRGLAPYYEFGHIFHVSEMRQLEELEYELIHFPRGQHDDVIDALATILEFCSPPTTNSQSDYKRTKRAKMFKMLDKPRSPLTGV